MAVASQQIEERAQARFETCCGVILALFAATLAWSEMQGGNVAEDRALAANNQVSTYSWYQSKSIKQNLAENTLEQLSALAQADAFHAGQAELDARLQEMQADIDRYAREKDEILKGSSVVGEGSWAQELGGELGKIVGADQYRALVDQLGAVDNTFDRAGLFLQLCLVLGALSLVFKQPLPRYGFLAAMVAVGLVGVWYAAQGYSAYLAVTQAKG